MPPPLLRALRLTGYRGFTEPVELAFRPLTLILGRNSAGKSAAMRALAILERSVQADARSPWESYEAAGPGRGADFERFCNRSKGVRHFTLGLCWRGVDGVDELTLRRWNDDDLPAVSALRLHEGATFHQEPDGPWFRNGEAIDNLLFAGLLPLDSPWPELVTLAQRLRSVRNEVQWLHGSRVPIPAVQERRAPPRILDPSGVDAPQALAAPQAGGLLRSVGNWYRDSRVSGGELEVERLPGRIDSLRLRAPRQSMALPLADAGDGLGKVLPVLVAAHAADRGEGPGLVLVEDPEVHLHDDATRALGEHLASLASGWDDGRAIVLETHSRTLLLSVQLAVSRGTIPAEKVGIVWADEGPPARLDQVALAPTGAPVGNRLRAAFREDAELAAALAGLSTGRA